VNKWQKLKEPIREPDLSLIIGSLEVKEEESLKGGNYLLLS